MMQHTTASRRVPDIRVATHAAVMGGGANTFLADVVKPTA